MYVETKDQHQASSLVVCLFEALILELSNFGLIGQQAPKILLCLPLQSWNDKCLLPSQLDKWVRDLYSGLYACVADIRPAELELPLLPFSHQPSYPLPLHSFIYLHVYVTHICVCICRGQRIIWVSCCIFLYLMSLRQTPSLNQRLDWQTVEPLTLLSSHPSVLLGFQALA